MPPRAEVAQRGFDVLAPPVLYGGMFLYLFGLAVIDCYTVAGQGDDRLRYLYLNWKGVNFGALTYIWVGFLLFVFGYYLPVGRLCGRVLTSRRALKQGRASTVTAALFLTGAAAQWWVAQRAGFSHIEGLGPSEGLAQNLQWVDMLNQLMFLGYTFGLWRYALSKRPGGPPMSRSAKWFFWGLLCPSFIAMLVVWSSRSRIGYCVFASLLAFHYGYRRAPWRRVIGGGLVFVLVLVPAVSWIRSPSDGRPAFDSISSGASWTWDMVMKRTSALESFTVIYESLDQAPEPDPISIMFASVVPRVVWPGKPFTQLPQKFSAWVSDNEWSLLTPSLPGELLLHFGYVGALVAMFGLGVFWRTMLVGLIGQGGAPSAGGFIYIYLLPISLQFVEAGFAVEYGSLLRFLIVGLLALWAASSARGAVRRSRPASFPGAMEVVAVGSVDRVR